MTGQTIPQQKPLQQVELTPRDDIKKLVSEVLKRVDQLIRKGDLDRAQGEILHAKELDPRNVYALALEERISTLRAADGKMAVQPVPAIAHPAEAPESHAPVHAEAPTTAPAPPIPATVAAAMQPPSPPSNAPVGAATMREKQVDQMDEHRIELDSYRKALNGAWCDGNVSADEDRQLRELRVLLDVSDWEHDQMEKSVKHELYKNALLQSLSNGQQTTAGTRNLGELRRSFQISDEEHTQIHTQLMSSVQRKQRDKVLVIDDDTRLLELLSSSLEDSGFEVIALPTSDEAYALLRKLIPDLILCDINLETSTMGGFAFYEKVQELKNIQHTPFIFLTGLTDEALVRTGKELGVDDYLMKPISEQMLVSTLRGKLKRFRQLKRPAETTTLAAA